MNKKNEIKQKRRFSITELLGDVLCTHYNSPLIQYISKNKMCKQVKANTPNFIRKKSKPIESELLPVPSYDTNMQMVGTSLINNSYSIRKRLKSAQLHGSRNNIGKLKTFSQLLAVSLESISDTISKQKKYQDDKLQTKLRGRQFSRTKNHNTRNQIQPWRTLGQNNNGIPLEIKCKAYIPINFANKDNNLKNSRIYIARCNYLTVNARNALYFNSKSVNKKKMSSGIENSIKNNNKKNVEDVRHHKKIVVLSKTQNLSNKKS